MPPALRESEMADPYPPSAFYFTVRFAGFPTGDTAFQEVSGISSKLETEPYLEGGENRYVYQLPIRVTHSNLVLKRGIGKLKSPLVVWCKSVLETGVNTTIAPMPINVSLLNEDKTPVRTWAFFNAFPVSWEVENFSSTKNEVAIEKIELSYSYADRLA